MKGKHISVNKSIELWRVYLLMCAGIVTGIVMTCTYNMNAAEAHTEIEQTVTIDDTISDVITNVSDVVADIKTEYKFSIDMVDPETGSPVNELPTNIPSKVLIALVQYAYNTMNINNYATVRIIECVYDPWSDGVSIHYVFDDIRYQCVWFDYNSDGQLLLYDKALDDIIFQGDLSCM